MRNLSLEPLAISALEHFSYCPRQCALIHIESVWDENLFTTKGRHVHESVHEEGTEFIEGERHERSLPIWSRRLGLTGKADLVEFRGGVPYPVEYKSGKKRKGRHEELQLCAQAVCLEEMFGVIVTRGSLYWHGSRQRQEIEFTDILRDRLEAITPALRELIERRILPEPVNDARCPDCSLIEACMPAIVKNNARLRRVVAELFSIDSGL